MSLSARSAEREGTRRVSDGEGEVAFRRTIFGRVLQNGIATWRCICCVPAASRRGYAIPRHQQKK
jgi:hypothetical protein